jgi:hypothetical protein
MARYRPIPVKIWDSDEVAALNLEQKAVYAFLLTNHRTTESGIYELKPRTASFELGTTPDRLIEILKSLKPLVYLDIDRNIVFVRDFLSINGMSHGNRNLIGKSILKDASEFKSPLWMIFKMVYRSQINHLGDLSQNLLNAIIENEDENEDDHESDNDSLILQEAYKLDEGKRRMPW